MVTIFKVNDKTVDVLYFVIIAFSVFGFWFRFFFYDKGFLSFGNSLYPIGNVEIVSLLKDSLFIGYQPYSYGGFIPIGESTIFSYLENIINWAYVLILSQFLGFNLAEKVYILTLNVFFGFAFYYLAEHILKSKAASMLSTIFILFNPFQLELLSYGDTGQLEQMAFLFLSLSFFVQFLNLTSHPLSKLTESIFLLMLVYPFNQAFYLGIALFLVILLYKLISSYDIITYLKKINTLTFIYLVLIPFILLAVIWPFLHGGYNLSPSSGYAQPLSNFESFSSSLKQVFFLEGYTPFISIQFIFQSFGRIVSLIWNYMFLLLLVLSLFVQWVARYRPGIYLSLLIFLASLLGSGALSPVKLVNIWLYLHFPGFQLLNTSYYWDWIIIAPIYAIEIGYTYKIIHGIINKRLLEESFFSNKSKKKANLGHYFKKLTPFFFVTLLLVIVALPISTQLYYSDNYIHSVDLPQDYYSLPSQLTEINNKNYSGVAFFNPDNLLYFNNTDAGAFNSPFFNMIPFKTYGIPNYGAPPINSTYYIYWVYSLFYHNETKYVGDLLSLLGIKYFVVLYNTNSESGFGSFMPWSNNVNASEIMAYQKNVVRIYSSMNYSIYLNKYYSANDISVSKMTLLLGNFNILNEIAGRGVNLSDLGILFPWDLSTFNSSEIMRYVGNVIYQPNQLNLSVSLDPFAAELNLIGSTLAGNSDFQSAWVPLDKAEGGSHVIFTLQNGIVTEGDHWISVPLDVNKTGNYTILVQVYRSSNGGYLSMDLNNFNCTLQTRGNNGTLWIEMNNISLTEGINSLSIHSVNGYNMIESAYFVPTDQYNGFRSALLNYGIQRNFSFISVNNLNGSSTNFGAKFTHSQLNWGGFLISASGNITVSHNQFFSTFSSTSQKYALKPIFGGINFIVISTGSNIVQVDFYPSSFYILAYIVPSIAIASIFIISIVDYRWGSK